MLKRDSKKWSFLVKKEFRRSHINTETKYLMLKEAFETLKVIRISFRVDTENLTSEKAVLRIGAIYEGTLRNGGILPDGRKRDYKIYGIIDSEWPSIKMALQNKM